MRRARADCTRVSPSSRLDGRHRSGPRPIESAVAALTAAADEDRATGGVDLERGIFPIIKICTQRA